MEPAKRDSGLECLALMLRFHQIAADPAQISHQFAGEPIGIEEILRCAKRLKLKARAVEADWKALARMPLPAIAALKDGTFIIIGKAADDALLVQNPLVGRPQNLSRAEFEESWNGRVVLMTRLRLRSEKSKLPFRIGERRQ